jgi:hypothetical protein
MYNMYPLDTPINIHVVTDFKVSERLHWGPYLIDYLIISSEFHHNYHIHRKVNYYWGYNYWLIISRCCVVTKCNIIILRLHLSVCTAGRWPEAIRPELKTFLSRHRWTWDITTGSLLTWLAMAQAATKVSCFKMMAGQNYIKCTVT